MATRKSFDAVAMVRKIRDAHYEQLKDKSIEERMAFYREKSRALHAELKKQQERTKE